MRIPENLIWNTIGDVFSRVFRDEERRPVESFWQGMTDLAADALSYINTYKDAFNPFYAPLYAKWGKLHIEPIDVDQSPNGSIIEQQENSILIYAQEQPNPFGGYFRYNNRDYEFFSSSFHELPSGGGIAELITEKEVKADFVPSSDFCTQRWGEQGAIGREDGVYNIHGLNWGILRDELYLRGDSKNEHIWEFDIHDWGLDDSLRSVSVNSFGDIGSSFEIRVQNTDFNEVSVFYGKKAMSRDLYVEISGDTITRNSGSFSKDGFNKGMEINLNNTKHNDGVYKITSVNGPNITVGTNLEYEETTGVIIDHPLNKIETIEGVPENITFKIKHNIKHIQAEVWVDDYHVKQNHRFDIYPGRRTHSLDVFSENGELSVEPKYFAVTEGELWHNDTDPSLIYFDDTYTFKYETDQYIAQSGDVTLEPWSLEIPIRYDRNEDKITVTPTEDWNGYLPEYGFIGDAYCKKVSDNTFEVISDGDLDNTLHSFVCDVIWDGTSSFCTPFEIPEEVFLEDTRIQEMDLHNRFGLLLRMTEEEDSQEYLDAIRGMKSGLMSQPTEYNIKRGVSMILGAPYAKKSGILHSITTDSYYINNTRYEMEPRWSEFIIEGDQSVDITQPLVDIVEVFDYITEYEESKKLIDDFKRWSTFVVRIPDTLGSTTQKSKHITRFLNNVKNKRTEYILRFFTEDFEPPRHRSEEDSYGIASAYEGAVSDDGNTIVNNSTNLEKQDDEPHEHGRLDVGIALDSQLVRFKPKINRSGDIFRKSVHLNRGLSEDENSIGFNQKFIRFGNAYDLQTIEIGRVVDDMGNLASLEHEFSWKKVGDLP